MTTTAQHKINIIYVHSQCTACEERERERLRWGWLLARCAVSCRLSSSRGRSIHHGYLQAAAPAGFDRPLRPAPLLVSEGRNGQRMQVLGTSLKTLAASPLFPWSLISMFSETTSSDLRNLIFKRKQGVKAFRSDRR